MLIDHSGKKVKPTVTQMYKFKCLYLAVRHPNNGFLSDSDFSAYLIELHEDFDVVATMTQLYGVDFDS